VDGNNYLITIRSQLSISSNDVLYQSLTASAEDFCSALIYLGTLSVLLFPLPPRCLPYFPGSGDAGTLMVEEM